MNLQNEYLKLNLSCEVLLNSGFVLLLETIILQTENFRVKVVTASCLHFPEHVIDTLSSNALIKELVLDSLEHERPFGDLMAFGLLFQFEVEIVHEDFISSVILLDDTNSRLDSFLDNSVQSLTVLAVSLKLLQVDKVLRDFTNFFFGKSRVLLRKGLY